MHNTHCMRFNKFSTEGTGIHRENIVSDTYEKSLWTSVPSVVNIHYTMRSCAVITVIDHAAMQNRAGYRRWAYPATRRQHRYKYVQSYE